MSLKTIVNRSEDVGESLEECIKACNDWQLYALRNEIRAAKPYLERLEQEADNRERMELTRRKTKRGEDREALARIPEETQATG